MCSNKPKKKKVFFLPDYLLFLFHHQGLKTELKNFFLGASSIDLQKIDIDVKRM